MQFIVKAALSSKELPNDYRRGFLSLIKTALQAYGSDELVKMYYGAPRPKKYCFSIYLPGQRFEGGKVSLERAECSLTFSSPDYETLWTLYNSFLKIKGKPIRIGFNELTICGIAMLTDRPVSSKIVRIKWLAPLVLRNHHGKNSADTFTTCEDENFEAALRQSVSDQLDAFGIDTSLSDNLRVLDKSAARRTVVRHYERYIPVTIGTLVLFAQPILLDWLRQIGCGSYRSAGFGVFSVVEREVKDERNG